MEHSGGEVDSLGHVLCAGSPPLLQSIFCACLNPFITPGPGVKTPPSSPSANPFCRVACAEHSTQEQ